MFHSLLKFKPRKAFVSVCPDSVINGKSRLTQVSHNGVQLVQRLSVPLVDAPKRISRHRGEEVQLCDAFSRIGWPAAYLDGRIRLEQKCPSSDGICRTAALRRQRFDRQHCGHSRRLKMLPHRAALCGG